MLLTVEKILVEQKTKGVQTNGCTLNGRFNQNGIGSGNVCGSLPLSTGCRQGSWIFGHTDVH